MIIVQNKLLFQDAIIAPANGVELTVTEADSLTVQTFGTSTSRTVVFEGTVDGTNWATMAGVNLSTDFSVATGTTASGEVWNFSIGQFAKVRMRVSAVAGGNFSIFGRITKG